jgi:hypothetical protein
MVKSPLLALRVGGIYVGSMNEKLKMEMGARGGLGCVACHARAIIGVRRLLHTGLAVGIAVGAVGADGVLPDDASQIGTRQINPGQIGSIEVGAGQH